MTARLFSRTGETSGLTLDLDGEAIVGRDPASQLVIDRPLMSSRHARFSFDSDAGRWTIEDLGSLNGTELDGDGIRGPEHLGHLHVITFAGSYDFFFQDLERCARRHPQPRPAAAEPPAATPAAAAADSQEVTSIEREPVAVPGFLARRADALKDSAAAKSRPGPRDVTTIERDAVALPGSLARRADAAREAAGEAAAEEEALRDRTIHEKLPVAMPGILARRAEKERAGETGELGGAAHETVDLAEIEELIAGDPERLAAGAEEGPGLHLVVTEAGGKVRRFALVEGRNFIGRGAGAQIPLDYRDLSRRHAVLVVRGGEVSLRDLGSRNRTFVDDVAIEPEVDVGVSPGARLRFGSVEARLVRFAEGDGEG